MTAVAEAPLLTEAQIAVISSQMGLTPIDFDVAGGYHRRVGERLMITA
jgi:hypothetical protein